MSTQAAPLQFDADTHVYQVAGRTLPSVTQVINSVIPRSFNPDEWYLQRGTATHRAIQLLAANCLDWDSVDERIKPRLDALLKFQRECRAVIIESEIKLASARFGFAGTIDALIEHDAQPNEIALTDFKNGIEVQIALQLGAYWLLVNENMPHVKLKRGLGLHLKGNGSYSCHWFDKTAMIRASQTFLAALTIYNFKQKHHIP